MLLLTLFAELFIFVCCTAASGARLCCSLVIFAELIIMSGLGDRESPAGLAISEISPALSKSVGASEE